MDMFWNGLIASIYLILNFLTLKYELHIYQLNYYMSDTQLKWTLKNANKFGAIYLLNLVGLTATIFDFKYILILDAILMLINIYLVIERNVKIKIVYTNRVQRVYLVNYIILGLLFFALFMGQFKTLMIVLFALNLFPTLYTILLNWINLPFNYLLNKIYVGSAAKILESMDNLKIITITGSYGKTSTKNYLAQILKTKYNVLATPGNFNTLLGIARTIKTYLKPTDEYFICEVGLDRVGQMEDINKLIRSDLCMVTAIGSQHLATFKSQENITKSKMRLLDGMKNGGVAFLNTDNEIISSAKKSKKYIGYGVHNNENNPLKITDYKYANSGITFTIKKGNEKFEFESKLLGEHNLIDLFGAISVADYIGIDMKQIINAVKHISSTEHRLEFVPGSEYNIIDDSYNSNPVGSKFALDVLKQYKGCRILITPGMVELGAKQDELNYEFGKIAASSADYIILVNKTQTAPIYQALKDVNFPKDRLEIVETFDDGFEIAKDIDSDELKKYILIENDLPDNY